MLSFAFKTLISAILISFCSWLANKRPDLAGFIISLPLTTLLVLLFSYVEFKSTAHSVQFAKSIFVGVPLSLTFFIPFLLAEQLNIGFWACYFIGSVLLVIAFFVHQLILL